MAAPSTSRASWSRGRGRTGSSAPTAAGSTSSRPAPGRWCCSCTASPSSGGPGTTSCPRVADAGFRAVAVDLRGYGASDKPPRGYDGYTMAADVAGLIRGARRADRDNRRRRRRRHDRLGRRRVPPAAGPPAGRARRRRTRCGCARRSSPTRAASSPPPRPALRFQVPRYEHVLTRDNAALVGELLRRWAGPRWAGHRRLRRRTRQRCREAMRIPQAAFCALEAYRWAFRSVLRLHGYRFVQLMQQPLVTPDAATARRAGHRRRCRAPRRAPAVTSSRRTNGGCSPGVGHFPHLEAPDLVHRRDPALGEA